MGWHFFWSRFSTYVLEEVNKHSEQWKSTLSDKINLLHYYAYDGNRFSILFWKHSLYMCLWIWLALVQISVLYRYELISTCWLLPRYESSLCITAEILSLSFQIFVHILHLL